MAGAEETNEVGILPIDVEIAYSPAPRQVELLAVTVPARTTLKQALEHSGWLAAHPDVSPLVVGIWGHVVALDQALRQGDRIEVYRTLKVDPKEARRQRYRAQGERGRTPPGHRRRPIRP